MRGDGSSSDISIDNMYYDHGECPTTDYKCDFEDGGYCEDMQNSNLDSKGSSFDWQVLYLTRCSKKVPDNKICYR